MKRRPCPTDEEHSKALLEVTLRVKHSSQWSSDRVLDLWRGWHESGEDLPVNWRKRARQELGNPRVDRVVLEVREVATGQVLRESFDDQRDVEEDFLQRAAQKATISATIGPAKGWCSGCGNTHDFPMCGPLKAAAKAMNNPDPPTKGQPGPSADQRGNPWMQSIGGGKTECVCPSCKKNCRCRKCMEWMDAGWACPNKVTAGQCTPDAWQRQLQAFDDMAAKKQYPRASDWCGRRQPSPACGCLACVSQMVVKDRKAIIASGGGCNVCGSLPGFTCAPDCPTRGPQDNVSDRVVWVSDKRIQCQHCGVNTFGPDCPDCGRTPTGRRPPGIPASSSGPRRAVVALPGHGPGDRMGVLVHQGLHGVRSVGVDGDDRTSYGAPVEPLEGPLGVVVEVLPAELDWERARQDLGQVLEEHADVDLGGDFLGTKGFRGTSGHHGTACPEEDEEDLEPLHLLPPMLLLFKDWPRVPLERVGARRRRFMREG